MNKLEIYNNLKAIESKDQLKKFLDKLQLDILKDGAPDNKAKNNIQKIKIIKKILDSKECKQRELLQFIYTGKNQQDEDEVYFSNAYFLFKIKKPSKKFTLGDDVLASGLFKMRYKTQAAQDIWRIIDSAPSLKSDYILDGSQDPQTMKLKLKLKTDDDVFNLYFTKDDETITKKVNKRYLKTILDLNDYNSITLHKNNNMIFFESDEIDVILMAFKD